MKKTTWGLHDVEKPVNDWDEQDDSDDGEEGGEEGGGGGGEWKKEKTGERNWT